MSLDNGKLIYRLLIAFLLTALGSACRVAEEEGQLPIPTSAVGVQLPAATVTVESAAVPATWTPAAAETSEQNGSLPPTVAPRPTRTPGFFPTRTPRPSPTAEASATSPATDTPTPTETATIPPPLGENLLPNPSFEEGWYHINGVPELQVPNRWQLDWEEGENPLDFEPAPWVRPEIRVLPTDFLPEDEHELFIWDGVQTVKIFKGQGAISFRLTTSVHLEPGSYLLEIHVFPDLVDEYEGGEKVWAPDPLSGEVRLLAGDGDTDWMLPRFGQKNTFTHAFSVPAPGEYRVGAAMRGRWAILNNGWFMDDWSLVRIGD